ncbi:hypothetical protein [Novosphingobium humi]|uniref:Uncharacterized protein n=1 Tax=Novosphingobium humi TaxID=2282397 RepID=A0ABY7U3L5_9SPHN|nr:hypothetical protein [Novosphingobium humi]WCT78864.1 hypothetical protein PQ457_07880 [Novosphingobium humi]
MEPFSWWAAFKAWQGWRRGGAWLLSDVWRLVAAIALVLLGWQTVQLNGLFIAPKVGPFRFTLLDIEGARPAAAKARAMLADRVKAEGAARAAQIAINHAPAAASRTLAEETDAKTNSSRAQIRAAVAAYADTHRVPVCLRTDAAPGNAGGGSGLPGTDHRAPGGGGADLSPEMVAIPRADLEGFADNTRTLDQLREFLAALIASGWAAVNPATPETPKPKEGQ